MDGDMNVIDLRSDLPSSPSNEKNMDVIDLRSDLPSPAIARKMDVVDLRSDLTLSSIDEDMDVIDLCTSPLGGPHTPSRAQTPVDLEAPSTPIPFIGDDEDPVTPDQPISFTSSRSQSLGNFEPPSTPNPYISDDEAPTTPTQPANPFSSSPHTPAWDRFTEDWDLEIFDPFINDDDDDGDDPPGLPAHPRSFDFTPERQWSGNTQSEGTIIQAREAEFSGTEYGSGVEYDDESGVGNQYDSEGGSEAESGSERGVRYEVESEGGVESDVEREPEYSDKSEGGSGVGSDGERRVGHQYNFDGGLVLGYQDDPEVGVESDVEREPGDQEESGGGHGAVESDGERGVRYQYDSKGDLKFGYQNYFESESGVEYGQSSEYQLYGQHVSEYQDDSDGGDAIEHDGISKDEVNGGSEVGSDEPSGYESDVEPGFESGELPGYDSDAELIVDFGERSEAKSNRQTKVESEKKLLTFEFEYAKVTAVAKQGEIKRAMRMIEDLRRRPDFTPFHNIMCLIMVVQVSPIQNHTIKSVLEECWDISHQFRDSYPTDQSITELDGIEANLDTVWERCKANDQAARVEAARPNWERFDEEMDTIDKAKIAADISAFVPSANNPAVSMRFHTSLYPDVLDHWTNAVQVNSFQYREATKEEKGEAEDDEDEYDEDEEDDAPMTKEKGEVEDDEDDESTIKERVEVDNEDDESDENVESDENNQSDEDFEDAEEVEDFNFRELLKLF